MDMNFINFTNHPSDKWMPMQRKAAECYGKIVDLAFPSINPQWSSEQVDEEAQKYVALILTYHPRAVLCQGEMTFAFAVIHRLQQLHVPVLAACSKRVVREEQTEDGATRRISKFEFVQFRFYL